MPPESSLTDRVCTAAEAAQLIPDQATIACGGFVGAAHPEALTAAIERRFLAETHPADVALVYAAGQGDADQRGLNHLAHPGLVRRVIGGHWRLAPGLGQLALDNQIEAWNFPQGVICHLLRDIAAGRPGCITHVGLGTFIDPAHDGGSLNQRSTTPMVERIELRGKTWLFYHAFPIHVGLIRATAADPAGNLSMAEEAVIGEVLPIAQAAHNCSGVVIAQVKQLLDEPLPPQQVSVPGILVDRIVVADAEQHQQTFGESMNQAYCTAGTDQQAQAAVADRASSVSRRIIGERACDELQPGDVANLGIGMPEEIAPVAADRGLLNQITLTVESGPIGGVPAGGLSFGASSYPDAVIDQPAQFDFYDGGGLNFAALGAAEIDQHGNINVSKFGRVLAGVGGFVNISQNARRVVFCGTMTSGGLQVQCDHGDLKIVQEGHTRKFVANVQQVSFSGDLAREAGRDVLMVTERAVFRLVHRGWQLVEIAPGIDLARDVLAHMDFVPHIDEVRPMNANLFRDPA